MKIVLAVLLVLVLLAYFFRLGVTACYDQDGGWVKLRLGPWRILLYPRTEDPEKAEKKRRKQEAKAAKKAGKEKKPAEPKKKPTLGGTLDLLCDLLPVIQTAAGKFRRALQIDTLAMTLTWGEEDPADAAIHYGYAWAVTERLLAFLEANFTIKQRQITINLDYQLEQPRLYVRAGLSLTAAQLVWIALPAGAGGLKILWNHRKNKKMAEHAADGRERNVNHGKESSC